MFQCELMRPWPLLALALYCLPRASHADEPARPTTSTTQPSTGPSTVQTVVAASFVAASAVLVGVALYWNFDALHDRHEADALGGVGTACAARGPTCDQYAGLHFAEVEASQRSSLFLTFSGVPIVAALATMLFWPHDGVIARVTASRSGVRSLEVSF